ncbi:MAG: hypothetical protein JST20_07615 [Bacteroidetes bacterium]|nr:hypothetical protein [Bacteroidota bacterium]
MTLLYFIILSFVFVPFTFAQSNTIIENFTAFENNGAIDLNWFISSGNTCSGIKIYRSADSTNFELIGAIEGVCGSVSTRAPYNFADENPIINSFNYYKLELGGRGSSEVISVEIIDKSIGGYQIRPSPITTKSKLYFDNLKKSEHQIHIYSIQGVKLYSGITNDDYFLLNSSHYASGIFYFVISPTGESPIVKGTFFVLQ